MGGKIPRIMLLKICDTKGDRILKQAILSMVLVLLATGFFVAMVLYTLWEIRMTEVRILLGVLSGLAF